MGVWFLGEDLLLRLRYYEHNKKSKSSLETVYRKDGHAWGNTGCHSTGSSD